jgi:hypothetical protein
MHVPSVEKSPVTRDQVTYRCRLKSLMALRWTRQNADQRAKRRRGASSAPLSTGGGWDEAEIPLSGKDAEKSIV